MAAIRRILGNEQSAILVRHASVASIIAAASIVVGVWLIASGNQLYEDAGQRVLWALAASAGALG
jgi:hypothetical protein